MRIDTARAPLASLLLISQLRYTAVDHSAETKTAKSPFLFLALDLPKPPLFQDSVEKNIIPQVALATILAKYDGRTTHEFGDTLKRHKLERLPPYLILHTKRFTKNNFVEEKNPTIVNFPLRGVDMGDCTAPFAFSFLPLC